MSIQITGGLTISGVQITPPSIDPFANSLIAQFNADPAWSNQVILLLNESNLAGPTIPVDVTVDWGDGNTQYVNTDSTLTYIYGASGLYDIKVTGNSLGRFAFVSGQGVVGVSTWGNLAIESLESAFYNSTGVSFVPNNIPSSVLSTQIMFGGSTNFNDSNISLWNTSNVANMNAMFFNAFLFNQDLQYWDTSNVTDMGVMFSGASAFDSNISTWNTGKVTDMSSMFTNTTSFNQDIGSWNTGNVVDMHSMFGSATAFNQNLTGWNTAKVANMYGMFTGASAFDSNISTWNTGNVTNTTLMFVLTPFNQDISLWNMSKVTDMTGMFALNGLFNQDIGSWNTSNVTIMDSMFLAATAFNQDLSGWCVTNIVSEPADFSTGSALTEGNKPVWGTCPP